MTAGWRVVSETVKQKWKVSADRTFKPTSNARNEAMFRDATVFADRLRKFKKDMQSWQKRIEGSFGDINNTMNSTLPQAYDVGHDGRPAPISEPKLIGAGVDVEMLEATAQEYNRRLHEEVIRPVKEWLHAYDVASDSMKHLEAMRLDLDSRRRTVDELQGKYERQQSFTAQSSSGNKPPPSPRVITEMQQTYSKMRHKEDKLQTAHHSWEEAEATVWEQLRSLVEASVYLRDYMVAFVVVTKDCFSNAYSAFIPGATGANSGLPQGMAGLRINTTPKGSPYSKGGAQTPTKKLLAQVASAMMGAAKKTKGALTPRAGSMTPTRASPFKPDPYHTSPHHDPYAASPMGTPTSTAGNPYFKESSAGPTDQYTPSPYSKTPGTPHAAADYYSPKVEAYAKASAAKDLTPAFHSSPKEINPYTSSPSAKLGTPKGGDVHAHKAADQLEGSVDPYSNYQPAPPKWAADSQSPSQYAIY